MTGQREKALEFGRMHRSDHILVLPNAWDVPSARVFENAGFPAIATSSGGVSVSLGYPDGENISRTEMISAIKRMAVVLSIPLTADMEAGFGSTTPEIEETTREIISSGAVGLNIEDASKKNKSTPLFEIEDQIVKIKAIRRISSLAGIPLVINARTDAFRHMPENSRLEETIARGNAYREAGADCIFPFFVKDAISIGKLVEKINCPVNIRAGAGSPTISELEALGVARASLATGPVCSVFGHLKKIAMEIRQSGTYHTLTLDAITHDELNALAIPL
jgi:2-methylisocitrate lyase-like PEP mutase family enzyme